MEEKTVKKILEFWFGDIKKSKVPDSDKQNMWWLKDKKLDDLIKNRFEKELIIAKSVNLGDFDENPEYMLAHVILLDQFSRNIYRDTPKAFSQDIIALNITLKGIENGIDKNMCAVKRAFFYLPLMHSDDIEIQKKSVECYSVLEKNHDKNDEAYEIVKANKKYAIMHYDIIKRFGRYPHRNQVLGRESTAEENEFLKQPGSSF